MGNRYSRHEVSTRLLKGLDFAVFLSLGLTCSFIFTESSKIELLTFFAVTTSFLCLFCIRGFALYDSARRPLRLVAVTAGLVILLGCASALGMGLVGVEFTAKWYMAWCAISLSYVAISRLSVQAFAPAKPSRQRIAIVGGGQAAEDAINTLEKSKDLDVEIVGLFDDRFDNRSPAQIRKHKKIGKIAELADYHRANPVDLVIVAIPMSAEQRLLQILKRIWELPVDIRVSAQASQLKLSPRVYNWLGDLPLLSVFDRPLNPWSEFLKDTLDRAIALGAILALSPVMAAVALAVRLESKGPIIFKQKRYGFNNELIEVFKFRSMFVDKSDAAAVKLVTKGDPRVTKVGRIIRKTSLDELPQLFNVLKGQLSLVGPRPHATQAKAAGGLYDQVVEGYFARHKVKPGITGWAQINGWRGETDTLEKIEQRVKHDLEYIDRWSLGFDFYIMLKTPFALLKSENAY